MDVRIMDPDQLREEAMIVLDIIASEFNSDPHSVQCFDLRIVKRAIDVTTEYNKRRDSSTLAFLRPF